LKIYISTTNCTSREIDMQDLPYVKDNTDINKLHYIAGYLIMNIFKN